MAGNLGTTELAASGVMLNICKFVYLSFPAALGIASSIRVGNILGQGKVRSERREERGDELRGRARNARALYRLFRMRRRCR